MGIRHVIVRVSPHRTLVDRQTLSYVTQRSESTIRRHCVVVEYRQNKAMYDLDAAQQALSVTPTRGHRTVALRP